MTLSLAKDISLSMLPSPSTTSRMCFMNGGVLAMRTTECTNEFSESRRVVGMRISEPHRLITSYPGRFHHREDERAASTWTWARARQETQRRRISVNLGVCKLQLHRAHLHKRLSCLHYGHRELGAAYHTVKWGSNVTIFPMFCPSGLPVFPVSPHYFHDVPSAWKTEGSADKYSENDDDSVYLHFIRYH